MSEHQTNPVAGYTNQSDKRIDLVNKNKLIEEQVLQILDDLKTEVDVDQRWLAIGRTKLEEAFMAINRSIFKPSRVLTHKDPLS